MTTTQHQYSNILRAIADGEIIEWEESSGVWIKRISVYALREIANAKYQPKRYRVKPKTITINGFEVPEPLREMPPDGVKVFWPILVAYGEEGCGTGSCTTPKHESTIFAALRDGLLHSTHEAAIAHAIALISLTKNKSK